MESKTGIHSNESRKQKKPTKSSIALFACFVFLTGLASPLCADASPRERLSLNNGWTFSFGSPDDLGYSRYLNKGKNGTRGIAFSKEKPQAIRLPHDWAVDLPPNKDAYDVSAFTPVGFRFPDTSIGWYKRTLAVPESDAGKTLWLEFDGIFRSALTLS
jgi:beta-galactosidase